MTLEVVDKTTVLSHMVAEQRPFYTPQVLALLVFNSPGYCGYLDVVLHECSHFELWITFKDHFLTANQLTT